VNLWLFPLLKFAISIQICRTVLDSKSTRDIRVYRVFYSSPVAWDNLVNWTHLFLHPVVKVALAQVEIQTFCVLARNILAKA
jgi:hypothetical protein